MAALYLAFDAVATQEMNALPGLFGCEFPSKSAFPRGFLSGYIEGGYTNWVSSRACNSLSPERTL